MFTFILPKKIIMKKITTPLLAGLLLLGSTAFSQTTEQNHFKPGGTTASALSFVKVTEKNSISASLFNGTANGAKALGVQFLNASQKDVSFSWAIKDKSGKTVLESSSTVLEGGHSVSALQQDQLSFPIADGQQPTDFTIEITIK